ncbi:MAG TPA: amidase [Humisphaera sp.]|jgi:amidase|nr:amidase [Humisphaera sp.]
MPVTAEIGPFSSATSMRRALRLREISAGELLDLHLQRIAKLDGALNSIVVKDFDRAKAVAKDADKCLAAGDERPLLGVPVTIKESLDVEGLPSTAGVEARRGHVAAADARTVARIRAAGAIILGKTNICTWLADYHSDNPVYGRTNNPWNLSRTSGGSSGGCATVAAGLAPIDIGSDLGGSIRVPPAFCGLWGHRPSDTAVCTSGHFPGSDHPNAAVTMAVQGPQARSARDCELALEAMAGPEVGMEVGWKLTFPAARHQSLRDFRVAVLPAQTWLPVDEQIIKALQQTADDLRRAGATVQELQPPRLGDLREYYAMFRSMMAAIVSVHWPSSLRDRVIDEKLSRGDDFMAADARGLNASSANYIQWHERREIYRCAWRSFFRQWDILLTPMTLTPAFAHTTVPTIDRALEVNGTQVPFDNMSFYPGLATLAGQPATAFPAGLSSDGLPIGLQAIGPFLEDRTPLRFAELLEELTGGFRQPPVFAADTF